MSKEKRAEDIVPLPDPEVVQERVHRFLEWARDRRGFLMLAALGVFAAVVLVLVVANLGGGEGSPEFAALSRRASAAREKLDRDLSAAEEIEALEAHVRGIEDDSLRGYGLWLAALYRHAEAWTPDKARTEEREPHLQKALDHLRELGDERYDRLLIAKEGWFGTGSPIAERRAKVEEDLAWLRENRKDPPAPAPDRVVVLRTELGDVRMKLFPEQAPRHVEDFVTLVKQGAYNETYFYALRRNVTQEPLAVLAGDPHTFFYPDPQNPSHIAQWGKGTAGYGIPPEDARFSIPHRRGIVTSARSAEADWDPAMRFQILLGDDLMLDGRNTPFAAVEEASMTVVDEFANRKTVAQHTSFRDDQKLRAADMQDHLVEPVRIYKAVVYRDGTAEEGHAFSLAEGERTLDGLKDAKADPLPASEIYLGRRMRAIDAEGEPRRGLDFPFPKDVDADTADPLGARPEEEKEAARN